jgi:glc operon protein GlcG
MHHNYKPILMFADAEALCSSALQEAMKLGHQVACAVVDDGGHLLAFKRMDGVGPAAAAVVTNKARTAATYRLPTQLFDELCRLRPGFLTTGAVALEGGVPVLREGHVIGALAVGGALPETDSKIAAAAVALLVN